MKCITPDIGEVFHPVEDTLHEAFLPYLFRGGTSQIHGRVVTGMLVKKYGITLPESTKISRSILMAYCDITVHLITLFRGTVGYWSGDNALLMGKGRDKICLRHAEDAEMVLGESQAAASMEDARCMGRIMWMGL